jgi:hypothetical protein
VSALTYNLANILPDIAILGISTVLFGFVGGLIAIVADKVWFRRWPDHSAHEDKLADTAHNGLLGFAAFVLALLVSNGFVALSKTEDVVRQEATEVYRLARELDALGTSGQAGRTALESYVRHVMDDEWPRLARTPASLSPLAEKDLADLWTGIRAAQRELEPTRSNLRDDLGKSLAQIETLRGGRLAAATSDIPNIFWLIIVLFVAAASFLSGRDAPRRFGLQISIIHMSAIGLVAGLVIALSNPFRGQTSVSATIFQEMLHRPTAG